MTDYSKVYNENRVYVGEVRWVRRHDSRDVLQQKIHINKWGYGNVLLSTLVEWEDVPVIDEDEL